MGAELSLRERITSGKACTGQGRITLTRSTPDRYLFAYVPDSVGYTVSGVITRQ